MLVASFAICFTKVFPFSLRSTILVFVYFFFGVVPLITYANEITYWNAYKFSESDYFVTNVVVILFLANFLLFDYLFGLKRAPDRINYGGGAVGSISLIGDKLFPVLLVAISILVFGFKFGNHGFDLYSLWTGGRLGGGYVSEPTQIEGLITNWFLTPMLSVCLVFQLQISKKINLTTVLLFLLLLNAATPVSISRFSTAVMYLPLIFFSRFIFIRPLYNIILLVSLIIVFPLLHLLRLPDFFLRKGSDFYEYWLSIFYSGDFDSYQSLMLALGGDLVTFGHQLLGPLLFFVPRNLWPGKPVGSGEYISEAVGLSFGNISASFLTEGYVNFGLIGVYLFSTILGILVARLDSNFWSAPVTKRSILMRARYLYSIPAIFFMMRGDLLSAFSSFVGIMLAVELVYLVVKSHVRLQRVGDSPALSVQPKIG